MGSDSGGGGGNNLAIPYFAVIIEVPLIFRAYLSVHRNNRRKAIATRSQHWFRFGCFSTPFTDIKDHLFQFTTTVTTLGLIKLPRLTITENNQSGIELRV